MRTYGILLLIGTGVVFGFTFTDFLRFHAWICEFAMFILACGAISCLIIVLGTKNDPDDFGNAFEREDK